jgi:hypothetical protein
MAICVADLRGHIDGGNMRRFLLLCPILLLLLAACGGSTAKNTPDSGDAPHKTVFPASGANPNVALANVSYFLSSEGEAFYIGEVSNTSQGPIADIKITLLFVDANGKQVARASFINPSIPVLQPGEKAPWKLFVGKLPPDWTQTEATVALDPEDDPGATFFPLTTEGVALAPPGKSAWVTGTGKVTNPNSQPLLGVLLILGLYDGGGKLLDVAQAVTDDKHLDPNGTTAFSAEFRNSTQIPANFKVFAVGSR